MTESSVSKISSIPQDTLFDWFAFDGPNDIEKTSWAPSVRRFLAIFATRDGQKALYHTHYESTLSRRSGDTEMTCTDSMQKSGLSP